MKMKTKTMKKGLRKKKKDKKIRRDRGIGPRRRQRRIRYDNEHHDKNLETKTQQIMKRKTLSTRRRIKRSNRTKII